MKQLNLALIKNSQIRIRQVSATTSSLGRVKISLKIGKITKDIEVHIMKGMKEQLLLGLDTAEHFKLTVDLKNRSVSQEHPSRDVIMKGKTSKEN